MEANPLLAISLFPSLPLFPTVSAAPPQVWPNFSAADEQHNRKSNILSWCKCPHSVPEDTFHTKPDTSTWMTLLLSVLHRRASSGAETYTNLCKFYLFLAAVLTTFFAAPVAAWHGKHPNAWCNPSAWQAHLFHFIFLRCSLFLGDQHCSISCSSAPARRSGELFYLHIRKNRWKMAVWAFHSAFL